MKIFFLLIALLTTNNVFAKDIGSEGETLKLSYAVYADIDHITNFRCDIATVVTITEVDGLAKANVFFGLRTHDSLEICKINLVPTEHIFETLDVVVDSCGTVNYYGKTKEFIAFGDSSNKTGKFFSYSIRIADHRSRVQSEECPVTPSEIEMFQQETIQNMVRGVLGLETNPQFYHFYSTKK